MHLTIARVDEVLFKGEAYSATVPGTAGEMTILSHHMPLVSTLKKGIIHVRESKDSAEKEFSIEKGVLEVTSEGATVIL